MSSCYRFVAVSEKSNRDYVTLKKKKKKSFVGFSFFSSSSPLGDGPVEPQGRGVFRAAAIGRLGGFGLPSLAQSQSHAPVHEPRHRGRALQFSTCQVPRCEPAQVKSSRKHFHTGLIFFKNFLFSSLFHQLQRTIHFYSIYIYITHQTHHPHRPDRLWCDLLQPTTGTLYPQTHRPQIIHRF